MYTKFIDYIISTLFVLGILSFLPVFFNLDMFDPIQGTLEEMQVSDLAFSQLRDYEKFPNDTNIILVNNGHLERNELAEVINIINMYEPKVIAIDAMFRKDKSEEIDQPLVEAFKNTENLVLGIELFKNDPNHDSWDTIKTSNQKFIKYADGAYVNMKTSADHFRTVRLITTQQSVSDTITYPSLSVRTSQIYAPDKAKKYLDRGNEVEVINFKRNWQDYTTFDYYDVFRQVPELEKIKGKIVLIGYLGPKLGELSTEDIFFTPMNKKYVGKTTPDLYGVMIHANVISMILDEDYIFKFPDWFKNFFLIAIVFFNMVVFRYFRDNQNRIYQALTIGLVFGELILLSVIIVTLQHHFDVALKLGNTFFAILVCVLCFETYTDSLKPLVTSQYKSYKFNQERKKMLKENKKKREQEAQQSEGE